MKKLICLVAGAALLGACEQKTEVVAPAPSVTNATPPANTETGQKPRRNTDSAVSKAPVPQVSNEAKSDPENAMTGAATPATETTTTSSPTP